MQTITQFFNNVAASAFRNSPRDLWQRYANKYGISYANFLAAYLIDKDIIRSFNGQGRWLVGDGGHYLDTGVVPTGTAFSVKTKFMFTGTNSWMGLYGTYWFDNGISLLYGGRNTTPFFHTAGKDITSGFTISTNAEYTVEHDYSNIVLTPKGGTAITIATGATAAMSTSRNFLIFANANFNKALAKMAYADITLNGTRHYYIPIKLTDGTCTMLDLMDSTHTPLEVQGDTGDGFTIEQ